MSTKIYYAYKIPQEKLHEFIDSIRGQIFNKAEELVRQMMNAVTEEKLKEEKTKKSYYSEEKIRFNLVIELCTKLSKEKQRTGLDLTFSLNIWLYNNYAYIIPIGEYYYLNNLKYSDWVEDYSYWNNTDKPDKISEEDWDLRQNIWEDINCGTGVHSHNARRLNHSIIDFNQLYGDIDAQIELENRIIRKENII